MSTFKPLWSRLFLLVVVVSLLAACSWVKRETYLVPEKRNAQEQFAYAANFELRTKALATPKQSQVYPPITQAYEAVIARFPQDPLYTPQAILKVGDLYMEQKKYRTALGYYDQARKKYADQDKVQAYSQLHRAQCYELLGDAARARDVYKQIVDLYSNHADPYVQKIVKQAQELYDRVLKE